jgi:hypothetical protein
LLLHLTAARSGRYVEAIAAADARRQALSDVVGRACERMAALAVFFNEAGPAFRPQVLSCVKAAQPLLASPVAALVQAAGESLARPLQIVPWG